MGSEDRVPAAQNAYIKRGTLRLIDLLTDGLDVPTRGGGSVRVRFIALGGPSHPCKASGYTSIHVRSDSGITSTLLYEGHKGGMISGWVTVRR